jgi:hypothetical protein
MIVAENKDFSDALVFACDEAACRTDRMFYEVFGMDDRWDIIRAILKAASDNLSPQQSNEAAGSVEHVHEENNDG